MPCDVMSESLPLYWLNGATNGLKGACKAHIVATFIHTHCTFTSRNARWQLKKGVNDHTCIFLRFHTLSQDYKGGGRQEVYNRRGKKKFTPCFLVWQKKQHFCIIHTFVRGSTHAPYNYHECCTILYNYNA